MESAQSCVLSLKRILLAVAAVVFLMIFWTWVSSPMIVTLTGTGSVNVPATSATVGFSLLSTDASPQGAIVAVTQKAKSVREMIKAGGVSEEDILESQVTSAPAQTGGYQALISMGAKTVHVTGVPDLIGKLYAAGAGVVNQPVLSVENRADLEAKAVDEAMKDAKKQASLFALKNLKFVRKIIAVSQQTSGSTSTATSRADVITESTSQEAAANGVFKIVKAVSVSYKMW